MKNKIYLFIGLALASLTVRSQITLRPELSIREWQPQHRTAPAQLPVAVDNSQSVYFPPILDQYGGSCAQAAGIHYMFTYEMNRLLDRPVNGLPEHIFNYRFTWNFLNNGEGEGGFSSDGLELTQSAGCMSNAYFPDKNESIYRWISGYDAYFDALHYRTKSFYRISLKNQEGIERCMQYLAAKDDGLKGGGVCTFSLASTGWREVSNYQGPKATNYDHLILSNGTDGAHALTIVGYDTTIEYDIDGDGTISNEERGAFIFVNSWDTWWGSEGRAYIPFYCFLQPESAGGLTANDAQVLCMEAEYHQPTLVFKVKLNYNSRNDLRFELGVNDGCNATTLPDNSKVYPRILLNQGGDCYMQGSNSKASDKEIEVAFDFSSKAELVSSLKAPKYFVSVLKTAIGSVGSGFLKEIALLDYRSNPQEPTVYSRQLDENIGAIKGRTTLGIPTLNWAKSKAGDWYLPVQTAASPLTWNAGLETTPIATPWAVRCADGSYAKMQVENYNPLNRQLKITIVHQPDGQNTFQP